MTNTEYGDPGWLVMFVVPANDPAAHPIAKPGDCP